MTEKEKNDDAFIEKIKTLGIKTSKASHPSGCVCPFCGKKHPMPKGFKVIPLGTIEFGPPEKPKPKTEETAFAA